MRPPALPIASTLAAALLIAGSVPVAAGVPAIPAPIHTGRVGVHQLIDTVEYRPVTCVYDQDAHLERLRIRRPIVFARDLGPGVDRARVAWRYEVMGQGATAWHQLVAGPREKAFATDLRNAAFDPVVHDVVHEAYETYAIRYRMTWYRPGSATDKVGTAVHWASAYITDEGGWVPTNGYDGCPYDQPQALTPEKPTDHLGSYGTHLVIDTDEYPATSCRYSGPTLALTRMTFRPTIVFAPNLTAGVDVHDVSRRLLVQFMDPAAGGSWELWKPLKWVRRTATDKDEVVFPSVTVDLGDAGPDHGRWRILVQLRFFDEADVLFGTVLHETSWSRHLDGDPSNTPLEGCVGFD